jgi:hypothetical protein
MSPRRLLLALSLVAVVGGVAAPALAGTGDGTGTNRICVNATNDRNHPGPAPLCVWLPTGDK